jgi:hypothetical protein
MHEYTGANDGMRCSDRELDPKVVEKRIRSLMKSPRKKPLKFGMAMFENGSCPLVSSLSAIIPYDTSALSRELTSFSYQLKSLGPVHFAHPLRRSNTKSTAKEEAVHSSGNKEEMVGDVDDTALKTQKVTPKKRVGSGKSHGGGGKSVDSHRFKAQRRVELETPSENTATINFPKSR